MSKRNDCLAAFPELYWSSPDPDGPIRTMAEGGMRPRDYFAAAAINGIMANAALTGVNSGTPKERAEAAYLVADAMLERRDK